MEIKIRDLDVGAVKIIDDLARKSKMSRNQYLVIKLERMAWIDKTQVERNRFEEALREVAVVLLNVQKEMEWKTKEISQLKYMLMQAMDVTEEEMKLFKEEFGLAK